MATGKMETVLVVLQEQRFKVCQGVGFTEQTPDGFCRGRCAAVKLHSLNLFKLTDKLVINSKRLMAVGPRRFILMLSDALSEESRHLEMGIAQQRRQSKSRSHLLGIERAAAVADKDIRLLYST